VERETGRNVCGVFCVKYISRGGKREMGKRDLLDVQSMDENVISRYQSGAAAAEQVRGYSGSSTPQKSG